MTRIGKDHMQGVSCGGVTAGAAEPMAILFCAEPKYFEPLAVAATSVVANAPGAAIDFHVLTCDHDDAAERALARCLAHGPRVSLTVHHVDPGLVNGFFVDRYLKKECYLRLLAAQVLPDAVKKVIYLDCDVVAVADLRSLWSDGLNGRLLAAAPDFPLIPQVRSRERLAALGIPAAFTYVNSGVLVMDLDRWRREAVAERLAAFIDRMGSRLDLHDQDAINAVLWDDINLLDYRWNVQARIYRCSRRSDPAEFRATRDARRAPAIIHYTGSEKPWLFRSRIPCKRAFRRYQAMTPWPDAGPRLASGWQRAEYRCDRALSSIGIDYLQVLYYARRLPAKLRLAGSTGASTTQPGIHMSETIDG
ncbi:Lipopolysaccharide biosynthesis protein, LPS:glycosyltransferase [Loktanella atrilutea]|uniref:Lipopolysaccharide biosynthesis protein, LPS:glycosyltransferase n=1 Tax=Loktanella atrilutea TaxID=366533 RepID=A0A1M4URX0_LOKAT|nr:glycosyltransferase family 8 protein [Loktanella atrilutea]SHE59444.1 Lipopolysaccharide biosynthesis protein, LPS:glycosyltransferase [Loktanella atrilutea]